MTFVPSCMSAFPRTGFRKSPNNIRSTNISQKIKILSLAGGPLDALVLMDMDRNRYSDSDHSSRSSSMRSPYRIFGLGEVKINEVVLHRHSSATLLLRPRLRLSNDHLANIIESYEIEPGLENTSHTATCSSSPSRICAVFEGN